MGGHDTAEDARTFWERSNARLGMDPADANPGRKGGPHQQVEMICSVCGTAVMCDRAPKSRHDVVCGDCSSALGGLIQGEERSEANALKRVLNPNRNKRYEGLPAFSEEDQEAIAELKAKADMGNGRSSNRRGAGSAKRRRRKPAGSPQGGSSSGRGNGGGGRSGRRSGGSNGNGGGNGNGNGGNRAPSGGGQPAEGGEGGRKRRRRRRRRSEEGGGGAPSAGAAAPAAE